MKETKQVKSNIKKEIGFIFEWGILIGVILSILDAFSFLGLYRYVYLHTIVQWPIGILTGILIAAVVVLLRRTTVLVTRDSVIIRRIGKKIQLSINDFHEPVIRRKQYLLFGVLKKITLKIYLNFFYRNGTKAYRLFEFSEVELEQVIQSIREQCSENMPVEEKLAVQDSFNNMQEDSPSNMFSLSPEEIGQYERKTILKIGGICIILLAVMMIFILCGIDSFKVIFSVLLLCIMLGATLVLLLRLSWKIKRCPESIRVGGNAVWVGEKYFSYTSVSDISMTSPRKKSDSIYPVQYWMTIKENGEKYKYWLGSQASYGEYRHLCKIFEQALLMYPNKLRYKGK